MLLNSHTTLPDGSRVRVRLPQASDRAGLRALHDRLGLHLEDLDIARMLRFDPQALAVGCATVWNGSRETVVGYGAIHLRDEEPHLLICDEATAPGVRDALDAALREHAATRAA
ncbi:MAG TPA: hypothetical protein VFZ89_18760 [Solirubrobacteraceae bacterium]